MLLEAYLNCTCPWRPFLSIFWPVYLILDKDNSHFPSPSLNPHSLFFFQNSLHIINIIFNLYTLLSKISSRYITAKSQTASRLSVACWKIASPNFIPKWSRLNFYKPLCGVCILVNSERSFSNLICKYDSERSRFENTFSDDYLDLGMVCVSKQLFNLSKTRHKDELYFFIHTPLLHPILIGSFFLLYQLFRGCPNLRWIILMLLTFLFVLNTCPEHSFYVKICLEFWRTTQFISQNTWKIFLIIPYVFLSNFLNWSLVDLHYKRLTVNSKLQKVPSSQYRIKQ